jgi:hypothetical protein
MPRPRKWRDPTGLIEGPLSWIKCLENGTRMVARRRPGGQNNPAARVNADLLATRDSRRYALST